MKQLCYFMTSNVDTVQIPAAAKSRQSCPTLCDPKDCSLPGSSIHEIFQARVLEWGAIAFSLSYHTPIQNKKFKIWKKKKKKNSPLIVMFPLGKFPSTKPHPTS